MTHPHSTHHIKHVQHVNTSTLRSRLKAKHVPREWWAIAVPSNRDCPNAKRSRRPPSRPATSPPWSDAMATRFRNGLKTINTNNVLTFTFWYALSTFSAKDLYDSDFFICVNRDERPLVKPPNIEVVFSAVVEIADAVFWYLHVPIDNHIKNHRL